ncbi:MAG TPA: helix-turn-helix domain-containing protein [Trueperaceae bacterium]
MDRVARERELIFHEDVDDETLAPLFRALASKPRLRILRLLGDRLMNVTEIAEALGVPISTANSHVSLLEGAGLLLTEHRPAARGSQKVCTRAFDRLHLQLPTHQGTAGKQVETHMPIGAYVDCNVQPTCGLASETGIIGLFDDPASFYEPSRVDAQLLWFHRGYVEYRFPKRLPSTARVESVQVALEVCSEAPLHHDDWPSDITVWINGVEVGTWTSPADFGGQRGRLTPDWWETHSSQYGLLKLWQVTEAGSFVDGLSATEMTLSDLDLEASEFVTVRIGIDADARHVGGINIFGRAFGNYPQDIVLRLRYE